MFVIASSSDDSNIYKSATETMSGNAQLILNYMIAKIDITIDLMTFLNATLRKDELIQLEKVIISAICLSKDNNSIYDAYSKAFSSFGSIENSDQISTLHTRCIDLSQSNKKALFFY